MRFALLTAAALLVVAAGNAGSAIAGEPVDNCATVLGSLSIELRFARDLPPGRHTTFTCARRYTAIVGASRQRVLRALGPPDRTGEEGWSYFFLSRHNAPVAGTPELVLRFGGEDAVESVDCRRSA